MGDAAEEHQGTAAAAATQGADPLADSSAAVGKESVQEDMSSQDAIVEASVTADDTQEGVPDLSAKAAVLSDSNAAGDQSQSEPLQAGSGAATETAAGETPNGFDAQPAVLEPEPNDFVAIAEDNGPGDGDGDGDDGSQDTMTRSISWNAWKGPESGPDGNPESGEEEPLEEGEKRPSPAKEHKEDKDAKKAAAGSGKGEDKEPGEHEQSRSSDKKAREKSKEKEKEKSKDKDKGSSRSSARSGKDKEKDKSKDKDKDRDRERGKDRDKDKDKNRSRSKEATRSSSSRRGGRTRSRSRSRSRSPSRTRRAEPFRSRGRSPPVPYERRAVLEAQRRERENAAARLRRPDEPGPIFTRLQNRGGPTGFDGRPGVDRRMPGGFGGPPHWDEPGMRPGPGPGPYRPGAPGGNFGGQAMGWMGPDGFRGRRRSPSPPGAAPFGMRRPIGGGPGRPVSPPGPRGPGGFGGPGWDRPPGGGARGMPSPPRRGFGGGPGPADYPGADYAFRQGARAGEGLGSAPGLHAGDKRSRDWRDEPEARGRPGGSWPDRTASSPRGMRPGGAPSGWSGREGGGVDPSWADPGFRRTGSNGALGARGGDVDQHWSPGHRADMAGFSRGGGGGGGVASPHGRSGWQDNGPTAHVGLNTLQPSLSRHDSAGSYDYARAQTHGLQQQQQQQQQSAAVGISIGSIQTQEWYYTDPQGETQGPCSIEEFGEWLITLGGDPSYRDEYVKFKDAHVFKQGSSQTIVLERLVQQAQAHDGRR